MRESHFLRTVTIRWSPGMGAGRPGKPMLGLSTRFFDRLLGELPRDSGRAFILLTPKGNPPEENGR